ncbi:MAG: YraN family protein [Candidatus Wildermuthbacteria bacterium]|nr:YraN family protein [Candidatus Wildermuthbacteria bacterium]
MNTKTKGRIGEEIAVRYLKKKGYKILDRNVLYRQTGGPADSEIDIVAKKGACIVFVEVKTSFGDFATMAIAPEDRVNFQKQKHILKGAERWLLNHRLSFDDTEMQIDVLAIVVDSAAKKAKVRHFQNVMI